LAMYVSLVKLHISWKKKVFHKLIVEWLLPNMCDPFKFLG
jgi:hypothetical protein